MQIIKDGRIIEDNWTYLSDNDALTTEQTCVSVARWQSEKTQLSEHNGKLGIRIDPTDNIEEIADDLKNFRLIEINFPVFTDGRGFSLARLLRSRYQYKGEIRAVGNFIPDQMYYLSRVGVNAFKLNNPDDLAGALSTLNDFSVKYQESSH